MVRSQTSIQGYALLELTAVLIPIFLVLLGAFDAINFGRALFTVRQVAAEAALYYRNVSFQDERNGSNNKIQSTLDLAKTELRLPFPLARYNCADPDGKHCASIEITPPSPQQTSVTVRVSYNLPIVLIRTEPITVSAQSTQRMERTYNQFEAPWILNSGGNEE